MQLTWEYRKETVFRDSFHMLIFDHLVREFAKNEIQTAHFHHKIIRINNFSLTTLNTLVMNLFLHAAL